MDRKKIRIGILGTAEIAFRRFLPALKKHTAFEYVGVASRDIEKTQKFKDAFGGVGYASYEELLKDTSIDAVYIPLPPALHYEWGIRALEADKHVFMEKPCCTSPEQTKSLIKLADTKNLVIHENYMFMYHKQLEMIKEIIKNGDLGEIRLYRIAFGFPMRDRDDFRYNADLGGGALLDCGGYTIKLAAELLGDSARIVYSNSNKGNFNVDLFGDAVVKNADGITAQLAFGMDNAYKCELEVWGRKGILKAPRIFTAPPDFDISLELSNNTGNYKIDIDCDNQFFNSIGFFYGCISDDYKRRESYRNIMKQSYLLEDFRRESI